MDLPSESGQVIAFYSFKGGTGRSMALANVGSILAQTPELAKPILLIDWDLEAPGLHRYFRKQLFEAFRGSEQVQEKSPGLIDVFIELRDRIEQLDLSEPQEFESIAKILADLPIEDYIIKTDIPRLHLLKAGRFDGGYAERIGMFDWPALYRQSPFLLKAFAARLAQDYRYILIDSRTGLTDTSSICTMLLPEILVTVFTPNRQSLSGVIDLITEAGRYRLQSEDLRPLIVYPLPSRIEASEPSLRQQWRHGDATAGIEGFQQSFEKAFKEIYALPECDLTSYFDDVQIQHVPRYAYGEELAVLVEESRDRFSLTLSFQRFTTRLLEGLPPWEFSAPADDKFTINDDFTKSTSEEANRRREAAAYLQRIEEPISRLRLSLEWISRLERAIIYLPAWATCSTLAMLYFAWPAKLDTRVALLILATFAIMAPLTQSFLSARKQRLTLSLAAIEQEVRSLKANEPQTSDALARAKGRVDAILSSKSSAASRRDGKIYISYRRRDAAYAGRIYDALASHFGSNRIFMDVNSISPGEDFAAILKEMVSSSDVMLVVIGPNWSRGGGNMPDFVETEIVLALKQDILTIPVLVGGVSTPNASEVPDNIRPLLSRNAFEVNATRWHADLERLIRTIDGLVV